MGKGMITGGGSQCLYSVRLELEKSRVGRDITRLENAILECDQLLAAYEDDIGRIDNELVLLRLEASAFEGIPEERENLRKVLSAIGKKLAERRARTLDRSIVVARRLTSRK